MQVHYRGLTDDARIFLWPYLTHVFEPQQTKAQKKERLLSLKQNYDALQLQYSSFLPEQIQEINAIKDFIRVIDNDVKRTDRVLAYFKEDNSPNLEILRHILTAYAIYNDDSGYVQGMGDFVSPLITMYIKSYPKDSSELDPNTKNFSLNFSSFDFNDNDNENNNKNENNNNKNENNNNKNEKNEANKDNEESLFSSVEVESFLFSLLIGFMEITQQDRLFTNLVPHQQFMLERTKKIVTSVHKPLHIWLEKNKLDNLIFLYRPTLLMLKRDFPINIVQRIWDAILSAPKPVVFFRCIMSSVLILLFPKLLLQTNGSLEEAVSISDSNIPNLDPKTLLRIAYKLEEQLTNGWECEDLPYDTQYLKYEPAFLNTMKNRSFENSK